MHLLQRKAEGTTLRRLGTALMVVLQLGASALLIPSDAILDIDRYGAVHIDSPTGSDCSVNHGHLFCQLVRSLIAAGAAHPVALPRQPAPSLHPDDPVCEAERVAASPIVAGSLVPRAPPAL